MQISPASIQACAEALEQDFAPGRVGPVERDVPKLILEVLTRVLFANQSKAAKPAAAQAASAAPKQSGEQKTPAPPQAKPKPSKTPPSNVVAVSFPFNVKKLDRTLSVLIHDVFSEFGRTSQCLPFFG